VLPRRPGEYLSVETPEGDWEQWLEVADFADSGPDDKHYTLDSVSGQIQFGPVIRQSDGAEKPYGATPLKNARLRFEGYRVGGGSVGNVGANALTVLKSSIPYVARVANRQPARGGLDQESIEAAKLRAPQMIRTRHRAVTAEDYEYLAREATPRVARARCIQPRAAGDKDAPPPGMVRVLIIPAIGAASGRVAPELLQPGQKLLKTVTDYLDERRLLTTALQVEGAKVVSVTVDASVVIAAKAAPDSTTRAIENRLYEFLNPLVGGPGHDGWPFGRPLHVSEIFATIQRVPGVEFVESVLVSRVDPASGKAERVDPKLEIPPDAVITSYSHRVQVKRFEF
jgi:predicted phage baseplate assembly protein